MGIAYRRLVPAPLPTVFEWHTRPGAMTRLTPPWLPMTVRRESTSLRDGRAEFTLPGGLRWVAQHRPDGYDPPHRFVDELTSLPLRAVVSWRHRHVFEALGHERTYVSDEIDTRIPATTLRPIVAYRHRQLAGDLASLAAAPTAPLTIAITGSNGTIGRQLAAFLSAGGHRIIRLVRRTPTGPDERRWAPLDPDPNLLVGADAVLHLAGTSIAGRFSDRHKREVRSSRVEPTRRLAAVAARTPDGPRTFVSASAIGIYGADRGDEVLTEDSDRGDGFLADVVAEWEDATRPAAEAGLRTVQVRTGIVQTPKGGVLQIFHPLFAAGLGGRLGDGKQWLSWIGIDDLVDVYHRALVSEQLAGPVNAVAPHPVRNEEYAATLAQLLHRPAALPTPALGPRVLLGREGADELALASQRVQPAGLTELGHEFRHAELAAALGHLLGRME